MRRHLKPLCRILPPGIVWLMMGCASLSALYQPPPQKGLVKLSPEQYPVLSDDMGYDGEEIELLVKAGRTTEERIGELIKGDLEDAGFNVDLRTMDSKTVDSKVKEWDFDLALSGHGGIIGDPNFLSRNTIDMTSFNSARYDANDELVDILEEQVTETDEGTRKQYVRVAA